MNGFQQGVFPFRYMGIPLASVKLQITDYSPLIDNLTEKNPVVTAQVLFYVGILELIRSVLQGSQFLLVIKHPVISWKTLCKLIEGGGLGLRY